MAEFVKTARQFHKKYDDGDEAELRYLNATISLVGTVKIHGTNAAVGYSRTLGVWAQSHKRLLTLDSDNFDFARYVDTHKERFQALLESLARAHKVNLDTHAIYVYGEYCGGKIQANVAVTGLPKMLVLFDAGSLPLGTPDADVMTHMQWIDIVGDECHAEDVGCYNVGKFGVYQLQTKLDPESLAETRETLLRLTDQVEKQCPVGRFFGRGTQPGDCTVGEGIVWRGYLEKSYTDGGVLVHKRRVVRLKVKGALHATSHVSSAAALAPEVCASLDDFVTKSVTCNRCEQGVQNVFGQEPPSRLWFKKKRAFCQWVLGDVKKEDMASVPVELLHGGAMKPVLEKAITERAETWLTHKIEME